jgi:hypothetical protein
VKAYNAIKNELKIIGFKFIEKSISESGGLRLDYKKGNIKVRLSSYENENSNGDKKTSYGIYVFKNYQQNVNFLKVKEIVIDSSSTK